MACEITVITPVYNAQAMLEGVFDSLKKQTLGFENLRWLLVDDQSMDGSWALIQSWAAQYENITALQTACNSGSAAAPRNLALGRVETPFVMFLDNDDAFAPDACRALLAAAHGTGADLVSGYFQDVDAQGNPLNERHHSCSPPHPQQPVQLYSLPAQLEQACRIQGIFWTKLYRMDIIRANAITFPLDTWMEDSVFFARYQMCCHTLADVDALIYRFRAREGSLSRTGSAAYMLSRAAGYRHLFSIYAGQPGALRVNLEHVVEHFLPLAFTSPVVQPSQRPALMRAWRQAAAYSLQAGLCPPDALLHKLMELCAAGRVDGALAVGELWLELRPQN